MTDWMQALEDAVKNSTSAVHMDTALIPLLLVVRLALAQRARLAAEILIACLRTLLAARMSPFVMQETIATLFQTEQACTVVPTTSVPPK